MLLVIKKSIVTFHHLKSKSSVCLSQAYLRQTEDLDMKLVLRSVINFV